MVESGREGGRPRHVIRVWPINPPNAYAVLTMNPVTKEVVYEVQEPTLSEEEVKVLAEIKNHLVETLDVTLSSFKDEKDAIEYLKERMRDVIEQYRLPVKENFEKLAYYIVRDFIGYGKIDVLMRDPLIEDISCNGVGLPIYVWHRDYESLPTNVVFDDERELDSFVIRLAHRAGRMITLANPILDASLPDGSRIQLTLGGQVTRHGSTFTIRKFRRDLLTIVDLIRLNTLSAEIAALLWFLIENRISVLVCGGAASGKTTLLNCLSNFIKPDLKIVTIEDTPELQLYHKNWVRSVTRPAYTSSAREITLFDLLKAAVRQRPDYIIVGEIRGEEAYTLFQAISIGHLAMATIHADSVIAAIRRLENPPMNIPRNLIAQLNIATVQTRVEKNGLPARRTKVITEIVGLDYKTKDILMNDIYRWDPRTDSFVFTGRCITLERVAKNLGMTISEAWREIERRKRILEWMVKKNLRRFDQVAEIIRSYAYSPELVFSRVSVEESLDEDEGRTGA